MKIQTTVLSIHALLMNSDAIMEDASLRHGNVTMKMTVKESIVY